LGRVAKDRDWSAVARLVGEAREAQAAAALLGQDADRRVRKVGNVFVTAAEQGDVELLRFLLGCGVPADPVHTRDLSALASAARWGRIECVRVLLDAGAVIDDENFLRSAMFNAVTRGHVGVAALLLERGARATRLDRIGNSLLHHAFLREQPATASLLSTAGLSLAERNRRGATPVEQIPLNSTKREELLRLAATAS
jgi:ankyrin repeat protein